MDEFKKGLEQEKKEHPEMPEEVDAQLVRDHLKINPKEYSEESLKEYITKSGDKFLVHAEDGRILGTHPTKAKAQAQLAAIEISKHKHESFKESTNNEETAQKMFKKAYKDLTPEEKDKVDRDVMASFWLGESIRVEKDGKFFSTYKASDNIEDAKKYYESEMPEIKGLTFKKERMMKETATSNSEDEWMRKMFKKGANPEEIAGVFKVQYGRDVPVSQVRYTVLGSGGFAKGQERFKESINSTWDSSTDREKISWCRRAGVTKDILDLDYSEIDEENKDKLWNAYVEGGNKESLKEKHYGYTYDEIAMNMFGKKFDELSKEHKDDVIMEYDHVKEMGEKLIFTNNIGQDIWVVR